MGLFKKRRALDPLVVDPVAAQSSTSPQDNEPGAPALELEDIAHESVAGSDALTGGQWGVTFSHGPYAEIDPKSVVPLAEAEPAAEPEGD